jgi:ornithine--oxo-acid transaminase
MNTREHVQLAERYGAHNYHPLEVVIASASGAWVTDVDGQRYLDMLSSYSALNFGHNHPALVQALKDQLDRVCVTSRAFYNDQYGPFCKALAEFCGMDWVLPMNSGAEAVETAIKTARKWAYEVKGVAADKAEIIAFANNFHGRTTTIVSFSTDPTTSAGFGPRMPGFTVVPYGDIAALEKQIKRTTAAILMEPIQGEGGIIMPPPGYLRAARELCSAHNVLLMMDEIQTGLGRTGRHFAFEHDNIRPDVLILGKALGGGLLPVSAVVSSREILGVLTPGTHGSTFGGMPLSCAVARRAIEVLQQEGLTERAAEMGEYFMGLLSALESPVIKEVRGLGLLIGVELHSSAGGARAYCEALRRRGVLCKETHENVIRFAPPLIIQRSQIDWAHERVAAVLTQPSMAQV